MVLSFRNTHIQSQAAASSQGNDWTYMESLQTGIDVHMEARPQIKFFDKEVTHDSLYMTESCCEG